MRTIPNIRPWQYLLNSKSSNQRSRRPQCGSGLNRETCDETPRHPVSREALYEEVWTDAVTVVAPATACPTWAWSRSARARHSGAAARLLRRSGRSPHPQSAAARPTRRRARSRRTDTAVRTGGGHARVSVTPSNRPARASRPSASPPSSSTRTRSYGPRGAPEAARRLGSPGGRAKRAEGSARPVTRNALDRALLTDGHAAQVAQPSGFTARGWTRRRARPAGRRRHDADDLDRRAGHANQPHADTRGGAGATGTTTPFAWVPGVSIRTSAVRLAPHRTADDHGGIVAVTEVERHGTQPHRLAAERHRRRHRRPGRAKRAKEEEEERRQRAYEEARARYEAQVARNEERRQLRALFRRREPAAGANRLREFIAAVEDRHATTMTHAHSQR